jgi:hypothetical protein
MCLDPSTGHAEWIDVDESNSAEVRAVNQIESHSPKRETDR